MRRLLFAVALLLFGGVTFAGGTPALAFSANSLSGVNKALPDNTSLRACYGWSCRTYVTRCCTTRYYDDDYYRPRHYCSDDYCYPQRYYRHYYDRPSCYRRPYRRHYYRYYDD